MIFLSVIDLLTVSSPLTAKIFTLGNTIVHVYPAYHNECLAFKLDQTLSVDCEEQLLTNGGHTISKWYKDNFLKGNYDKYNVMLLGRKNKNEDSPSINVKIDEQVIKSSPDLKLLGVTLNDELSFSTHISDICKKASKKVGVLVRLRNMIPREAKLQLYKSAILPNFNILSHHR